MVDKALPEPMFLTCSGYGPKIPLVKRHRQRVVDRCVELNICLPTKKCELQCRVEWYGFLVGQ